ncbi:MAG: alpha/beta hydrolase [Planctomycetota bacterium]
MRAEIAGDRGDGPALVYVPGIDGSGELLLGTAARLEAAFRLLRVRYVDEGDTGSVATYGRLADTLAEGLEGAGVERAVVLAESFGGGVALHLALRHPDRVRALAIVNSFCWYPRRVRLWLSAVTFPFVPKRLMLLGRRLFQSWIFFRPRRDAEAEAAFRAVPPSFLHPGFAARLDAVRVLDLRERLAEIEVPVELYASSHDAVVPARAAMRTLARGLPRARLTTLERANHMVLPLAEEPWPERLWALADAADQPAASPR